MFVVTDIFIIFTDVVIGCSGLRTDAFINTEVRIAKLHR